MNELFCENFEYKAKNKLSELMDIYLFSKYSSKV